MREGGSARTGQFCPKRAMLEAIDHAISVVRLTRTDRMAEAMGWTRGCRDNWTLTAPEVRVMTLGGASRPMQKRRGRFLSRLPLLGDPTATAPVHRHLFPRLWQRTHKKEYITKADNSHFWLFHRPNTLSSSPRAGGEGEGERFFFIGRILGQQRFPLSGRV